MNVVKFLILLLFVSAFAGGQEAPVVQKGGASYYAKKFEGRTTANGEKFSNYDMTCAHRKLPFNTLLKVTSIKTGISTIVRVNDRGPYKKGRIVDLSEQAARIIGSYMHGITKVEIEILKTGIAKPETDSLLNSNNIVDGNGYAASLSGTTISIWKTSDLQHALLLARHLSETEKINTIYLGMSTGKKKRYHLIVTGIESPFEAKKTKDFWERKGFMRVVFFD